MKDKLIIPKEEIKQLKEKWHKNTTVIDILEHLEKVAQIEEEQANNFITIKK